MKLLENYIEYLKLNKQLNTNYPINSAANTATTAGGATLPAISFGTAGLGLYFGSGAPTISAARGSLYVNTTGSTVATRLYVSDSGTTWVAVTTVS